MKSSVPLTIFLFGLSKVFAYIVWRINFIIILKAFFQHHSKEFWHVHISRPFMISLFNVSIFFSDTLPLPGIGPKMKIYLVRENTKNMRSLTTQVPRQTPHSLTTFEKHINFYLVREYTRNMRSLTNQRWPKIWGLWLVRRQGKKAMTTCINTLTSI